MSDDRDPGRADGGRRRGYHHGDLKAALIAAARALIGEKGPGGFTMAEAARRAKVSPSAPYRHYADRDALLAELALEGFQAFAARLEHARADPRLTPLQALDAVGRAYLAFAEEDPAAFAAMFETGLDYGAAPGLRIAAERGFSALHDAVKAVLATAPAAARSAPSLMVAHHIWAMSHGVATLNRRRTAPVPPEELIESMVGVYLRGLGVLPPERL